MTIFLLIVKGKKKKHDMIWCDVLLWRCEFHRFLAEAVVRRCSLQISQTNFTRKHLLWSLFLIKLKKETPTQVFSSETCGSLVFRVNILVAEIFGCYCWSNVAKFNEITILIQRIIYIFNEIIILYGFTKGSGLKCTWFRLNVGNL